MNHLSGALINGVGIILGSVAGGLWGSRLGSQFRGRLMRIIGLVVIVIGLKMALGLPDPVNLLLSLVVGGWVGSWMQISEGLAVWERSLGRRLGKNGLAKGFLPAVMVFNVGAMAIVGALQVGLTGRDTLLATKAILDGATALVLSISGGWGVMLAAPVTFVYEGSLSLLAHVVSRLLGGPVLADLGSVGGVLILAIGVNFVSEKSLVNIADLLPALAFTVILGWLKLKGLSFL